MSKFRAAYTLLLYLLLPYVVLRLVWRARRQPAYLRHLAERFGWYAWRPAQPVIWLHAVSVGETRAVQPLVKALQSAYPQHRILLTHMTPTGRETGATLFGDKVLRCYLPYDYPGAVQRFLKHFQPQLAVFMETELWPNLLHACHAARIPVLLANARLSEKSARKYARWPQLTAHALQCLSAIAAQTEQDAQRLRELGAAVVTVCGNVKFDVLPPENAAREGAALRELFGVKRPVFLAASTRAGEEAIILEAIVALAIPDLLTVIVPRHPQRFDEVAALIAQRGFTCQRKSANEKIAPQTQIVLGDTMGEMFSYYATCDVAFIGGSLLPHGGQNLIEASAMGAPALLGPHTFNFADATEQAIAQHAAIRVANAGELATTLLQLLQNDARRVAMREAALAFSQRHRGATDCMLAIIREKLLPANAD